jgi:hypothetical protein
MRIFDLLPKATETSLVNMAVASGILGAALQIESERDTIINATAQGTYSFSVSPHQDFDTSWHHTSGQVEIDGAFVARRNERETIFVVEAKVSDSFDSLAKHKIAYPMLAIEASLAEATPVVGVYLRVLRKPSGFEFFIAECQFQGSQRAISALYPVRVAAYAYRNSV